MTIYISGPITGLPHGNREAFAMAELRLIEAGHDPINPHHLVSDAYPVAREWIDYMRLDISAMMDADALLMLPGFAGSRGASIEFQLAVDLGIPVYHELSAIPAAIGPR